MTAPAMPRRYVLGAPEARSVLGRREPGEVSVLVAGVMLGLLASLTSGGSPLGFVALVAFVLLAVVAVYAPVRGRTLYRWLPVDAAFRHRQLSGRDRYVSHAREAGVDVVSGIPAEVAPPDAVGRVTWLLADTRLGQLAALVQADGRVTACIEIEGPGLGLADGLDQEVAVRRWGTLLRDLANSGGLVQRVSLLERCLPTDAEAHQRFIERFGWVPAPEPLTESYDQLHSQVGSCSEQHRNLFVVQLRPGRELHRAVRAAGGGEGALAAVAAREVETLAGRLEDAGVRVLRVLGEPELAAFMASCYAPWRSMDDVIGISRRDAWPRQARATATHLEADGWFHSTAWIRSWPLVPVGVDFLAPLLVQTPGIVRTVGVTLELVPTDVTMRKVMTDLTSDAAHASAAAKAGRTADPRDGRQLSQAEQRAADVAQGAAGIRLVGYVTVSAPDPESLDAARRQLRTAASRAWLTLEWCDREHDTAFVNTLPLGRGVQ
jgi:hypothetical protein